MTGSRQRRAVPYTEMEQILEQRAKEAHARASLFGEGYREGYAIGFAEGLAEVRAERAREYLLGVARSLLEAGWTPEKIASVVNEAP